MGRLRWATARAALVLLRRQRAAQSAPTHAELTGGARDVAIGACSPQLRVEALCASKLRERGAESERVLCERHRLVDRGTNTVGSGAATPFIGRSPGATNVYYNGDIAEVVFYNRILSPNERALLINYLNGRYGLGAV